jgi:hypothetical protein
MRQKLLKPLIQVAKTCVFRYTKYGAPKYRYGIEPIQLSLIINEIERLKDKSGNIAEIGVARGMTTKFICQHITNEKLENTVTLYAIDTFEGFVQSDLDYEVSRRGKSLYELEEFVYNDFTIWRKHFSQYSFVKAIKSDCSSVDYTRIQPLKLVFLDVDLYIPTKNTLPKLYESLIDGGVIIVDDVRNDTTYDGAYQAYIEFCESYKITPHIIGNKCGIIYKNLNP